MTQEAFTPTPNQTIDGTGPYSVLHGYDVGALVVAIIDGATRTILPGADWSVTPETSSTGGAVTLSSAVATAHDGKMLEITRATVIEQGWAGQTSREKGLEAQLDWMTRAIQDGRIVYEQFADATLNAAAVQLAAQQADAALDTATAAVQQVNDAIALLDTATLASTANARTPVTTAGTATALTIDAAETITAYAAGQSFLLRMHADAAGAATLDVDGIGARPVRKLDGTNAKTDIEAGDWQIGAVVPVFYDGTEFLVADWHVNRNKVADLASAQTLANKTLGDGTAVSAGPTPATSGTVTLDPANGLIQALNMSGNVTIGAINLGRGESMVLRIADGTGHTIDWNGLVTWESDDRTAPVLQTSGYNWITLWSVWGNGDVYGFASNGAN